MQSGAISLLLVSSQAEHIKEVSIRMRQFYPGCRIEAMYSSQEGVEWASKQEWHVIVVDEELLPADGPDLLQEFRRRAPHSALIVHTPRYDAGCALSAVQAGADSYLFRHSPSFLTDLPLTARTAMEKWDLRKRLEWSREQFGRLIDTMSDMTYELDAEGRFLSVNQAFASRLGYSLQELLRTHYTSLVHPAELRKADRRFNERRVGARATRDLPLHVMPKHGASAHDAVLIRLNAAGLYNRQRQHVGTIGVLREAAGIGTIEAPATDAFQPAEDSPLQVHALIAETERLLAHLRALTASAGPSAPPDPTPSAPMGAPPQTDRRRAARVGVHLDVRLSLGDEVHAGTVADISREGLYMVFSGIVPATPAQPIQLGFASETGVLELRGSIVAVREPAALQNERRGPLCGLAVRIEAPGSIEREVLGSLVEGLAEGAVSLTVTAILAPPDTGDLLLEIHAASPSESATPLQSGVSSDDDADADRRLNTRVPVALPARIERTAAAPVDGSLTNLSQGGACVTLPDSVDLRERQIVCRLRVPPELATLVHTAASEEWAIAAEVMWTAPDRPDSPSRTNPAGRQVGIRFVGLDETTRQRLAGLIAGLLDADHRVEAPDSARTVRSERLECRNRDGLMIALYHEAPQSDPPPGTPVLILSPGYGETKKEYVSLAYHLAANGFHVLRYDHTRHVGESDGEMRDSTLSRMKDDLLTVLDYAARTWPANPAAVVATSLAGRVAIKVASQDDRIRLLVLIAGVVDVQETLRSVHRQDYVESRLRGAALGLMNVLGFNIDADAWVDDAAKEGYVDLRSTVRDAERMTAPLVLFTGEHDAWVRLESAKAVLAALPSAAKHLIVIPEGLHRLQENPRKARSVYRQLIAYCLECLSPLAPTRDAVLAPAREIGIQSRIERERARAHSQMARDENKAFWKEYLSHFHYVANVSDFWHLLDHLYRLMGAPDASSNILDAGCGNGNFGMYLIVNQAYRDRHASFVTAHLHRYVGLDFVPTALRQARSNFHEVRTKSGPHQAVVGASHGNPVTSLCQGDLNDPLPFGDNQFDRIVSNLVIGYLHDPLFTLRELLRVLKPNGRLVLSNLKPQADLTQIYRNFVQSTDRAEDIEEARQLLNNSGKIKQGESDGRFRFFNRKELVALLMASGAHQPRIYTTFANQAYIAVARKPGPVAQEAASEPPVSAGPPSAP
jgi:PAS domain S-box-containing protein